MPDASTKRYLPSEVAQIIGIDEKQLHRYVRKGLLNPVFSIDSTTRFSEMDCVRLKIIKRADRLGYDRENIFRLIGNPDEVLNAANPVAAGEQFAMAKYKQIYDELNRCAPLEQLNKRSDLELVKSYIKHLKELGKKESPPCRRQKLAPQSEPLSAVEDDQASSGAGQQVSAPSLRVRRFSTARPWNDIKWKKAWIVAGLVAIIAGSAYFLLPGDSDDVSQPRVIAGKPQTGPASEDNVHSPAPTAKPSPESFPRTGTKENGQDSGEAASVQAAFESVVPADQELTSGSGRQTIEPAEPVSPAGTRLSGAGPAAPVKVEDLSLWHDSSNNIYRADFTIAKSDAVNNGEAVSGYAFVYLEIGGGQASERRELLLPPAEIHSARPVQVRRGAKFTIRRFKRIRVAVASPLSPGEVTSGKVLVFSSKGNLLLERPINVTIQPFFSAAEDRPVLSGGKSPPPSPPPAAGTRTLPPAEAQKGFVTGALPPAPETRDRPADPAPPIAEAQKTGHPQAAAWERKSYEAALQGDFAGAIAGATQAIELDPGRVNAYINRSWAYIEKGMLQQAIQDCQTALSIDPQNALAYNNRGLAYQRKARIPQAQDDYRRACELGLALGCQNFNALFNQARITELIDQSQIAFKARDWDGVIRAATEVLKLDPQNPVAYTNRSAAYAQSNSLDKALSDSHQAIKHSSDFSLAYNNRGYVFELLGKNKKAAADYLKSCSLGLDLGCKNFERLKPRQ